MQGIEFLAGFGGALLISVVVALMFNFACLQALFRALRVQAGNAEVSALHPAASSPFGEGSARS
jgi:hypothetical protein